MLITRFDVPPGRLPLRMAYSDATALRLLKHGPFGADLIRFPPGGRIPDHVHPGAHFLFVLSGHGWVDYENETVRLEPGVCYLIPEGVRHGVRADDEELTLLAVANDHRDAASEERSRMCN